MIRVSELRKSYNSTVAVDGVSLDIAPGETFSLLGPNGAGKTTMLKMMVGALKPDSGRIEIGGQADPTRAAVRRQIGIAPQDLSPVSGADGSGEPGVLRPDVRPVRPGVA